MPSEIRIKRIQDQIKQGLIEILDGKVNDPRLEQVYITDVTIDRELDFANIYVSALGGADQAQEILDALQKASGFIRYNLSQDVKLRVMPKLRFYWDDTPERAERIEALLEIIRQERESSGEPLNESEDNDDISD